MMALVRGWIRSPAAGASSQRLDLALRFDLDDALEPAVEIAEQALASPEDRQRALLVIGRLGNLDHLSTVSTYLADDDALSQPRGRDQEPQPRVQDTALAVLVHLTNQDPKEYGLDRLRPDARLLYDPRTVTFASLEARTKALRRWQTWERVNLNSPNFGPFDAVEGVGI
jgi:hypothetical protein